MDPLKNFLRQLISGENSRHSALTRTTILFLIIIQCQILSGTPLSRLASLIPDVQQVLNCVEFYYELRISRALDTLTIEFIIVKSCVALFAESRNVVEGDSVVVLLKNEKPNLMGSFLQYSSLKPDEL